nr:putative disease resistance protein RGA3 [Quercus suber]
METYGRFSEKVSHFFSSSNPLAVHFAMAHKIKSIRESLDAIDAVKNTFNLAKGLEEDKKVSMPEGRETHSSVSPDVNIVGRDDDKEKIIHLLMQQNAGRKVGVIPIVGMGGLGKTTLAKLAYNDDRVVVDFQLRMWVCVSENFDLKRLITEILKYEIGTIDESLSLEQLQKKLGEFLKDKRFLLVLDDVWNEARKTWTKFEELLTGGCNGSKIIVTTRNMSVAKIMDTGDIHYLNFLSTENYLFLFVELAFKEQKEKKNPNLLKIGEEIVKKCKGVPLAVSTLANMLYSKVDEGEWKRVKNNDMWRLKQGDDDILPILRLSYNQLPFHLKQCFVYCSLFPKGYEFKSVELIQIWMAHGILELSGDKSRLLEDVGDSYIKELLSRSFFQDAQEEIFCYTFKMHDLYHDLALSIAKGECSVVTKESTFFAEVSCLFFSDNVNDQEVTAQSEKLSKVQTIVFQTELVPLVEACISRFKYLRVLNLKGSSFEELSSSIGSLKHLRFFDLSGNDIIKRLPNSICKLYNLQTLILDCKNLEQLPKGIRNMISLRFLVVTNNQECLLEKAIGCMDSLRVLLIARFENLKCLFEGDRHLNLTNLRTLTIANCSSLTSLSLNIKDLPALEILIIVNCEELNLMEGEGSQNLELSLRKLMIRGLPKLEVLPQWLRRSENTLQMLVIGDCENFTTLPEWLPCLKSLQQLGIDNCCKLLSLPEGMQGLTTLRQLNITMCPDLIRKCEEDRSKIAHVPEVCLGGARLENQIKIRYSYDWHNKFWKYCWREEELR